MEKGKLICKLPEGWVEASIDDLAIIYTHLQRESPAIMEATILSLNHLL